MTIHDYQVLQRDEDDRARVQLEDGQTVELPVGGPYEVGGARNVLVGDLWVLAGQSNMEGVGDLVDVEESSPFVHSFQSRERWAVAEEPLHWLGESPRLIHHRLWGRKAVPDEPDPRDPSRTKGAGLGLSFARARYAETGVPVGLVPSAHGGTSMEQWDSALRDQGGASLYGATIERIKKVGGKVAGILWYQGESDASAEAAPLYKGRMDALVAAFRADCGRPDLPFYYVQIGRWIDVENSTFETARAWNALRETQRAWGPSVPHTTMVASIDLELDDGIHIGTQSLKRLGKRLADAAAGHYAPSVAGARFAEGNWQVRVGFDGVQGGLRAPGRSAGFTLRDAAQREIPAIYKTTLDGNIAVLHLATDALPPGDISLWYGWGTDPYCNVTDARDAAVPAFGPITIAPASA